MTDRARIEAGRIRRDSGFGQTNSGDGYAFRPTRDDEIVDLFSLAKSTGRRIVLRGAGRSYGDAAIAHECLIVDLSRMNRILAWDTETGLIEAEAGVTIEDVWRHVIEDGYWLPVVSGTMFPTLAGALAMNIHGKNNFRAGTLGEHVESIVVLFPYGELRTLTPEHPFFKCVVSGAGLLGVIVRVRLRLKKVTSGDLRVLPVSCPDWQGHFDTFETLETDADYMVSWIDGFSSSRRAGRGLFHAAWHIDGTGQGDPTLRPEHQDLPDTILGFLPKSMVWRFLKPFNNRLGMRLINSAKHNASRFLGDGKPVVESLVGFSFLLDYVPDWRKAYSPHGFIQYQSFVPKEAAAATFRRQLELAQAAGLPPFLAVMKRHRPDPFLLSHGVDGYSLALDFKNPGRHPQQLTKLAHELNELVVQAAGRFYLAKDSTLRPEDFRHSLPEGTIARFREVKSQVDPDGLLTSQLARRLELIVE